MKHHHHTAPEYYLKAFRIPDDPTRIWEYQRGKPYNPGHRSDYHNPIKRALKKASVKIDYYGAYEDTLATLEEAALPVIEKLRTTPTPTQGPLLTPAEKEQLTEYLGLFMKRTTAREERLPSVWNTVRPQVLIKLERDITNLMNQGRFTKARELQEEKRKYEAGMPEELRQRSTIEPYNRVRSRIIELRWTFLTTPTPALLTSDNPVRYPEHEGLGHDLAFLTMPWSTTIALFASTPQAAALFALPSAEHDCASRTVTADQVAILNHLTITGAHQYLYSHRADEDTAGSFG